MARDAFGNPADRVTPLVRAKGAEVGIRTVALPHLHSTVSVWTLRLASELVYNGDAGATEPGPASTRHGVEIANYYSPSRWLVLDADVSLSQARFVHGAHVPEAVGTVVSAGMTVSNVHRVSGSIRLRYFGSRALIEDNSVRSNPTTMVNAGIWYQLTKHVRITGDVFNLLNAKDSDIDYFFASRLPGEAPAGIEDVHFHPTVPRTLRAGLTVGF
jgi:outer membrane receptor protein involved in Fe transport